MTPTYGRCCEVSIIPTKSSQSASGSKVSSPSWEKPYPEFPLSHHPPSGRLYKKIKGKRFYFGYASDWQAALDAYTLQKDYILRNGCNPPKGLPPEDESGITIADLCNRFLTSKSKKMKTGELSERSFRDYYCTCQNLVEVFGQNHLVDDLIPDHFENLREALAEKRGPVALGNEIGRCRMVFKYAYDQSLIDRPVRYGQSLNKPSKKTLRQARAANGKRTFEAHELRAMIDAAGVPLKAMILLGINCGFGQSDIANLPLSAVDLESACINFPRPKTGVERRCALWPETVSALRSAIAERPEPKDEVDADLCFLTKYGNRWVRTVASEDKAKRGMSIDSVAQECRKLLEQLGLKRGRLNFYALRHTFQTIGERSGDLPAVKAVMGHVDDSMSGVYREGFDNGRLQAVVDVVRDWLFPFEKTNDGQTEVNEQEGEPHQ